MMQQFEEIRIRPDCFSHATFLDGNGRHGYAFVAAFRSDWVQAGATVETGMIALESDRGTKFLK